MFLACGVRGGKVCRPSIRTTNNIPLYIMYLYFITQHHIGTVTALVIPT